LDLRDKSTCPNLVNLSAWPSSKLKQTCTLAYEKQMTILAEHEGEDCRLLKTLKAELKEIKKIDADTADKEAKKFVF
jgi:hypothetical protein